MRNLGPIVIGVFAISLIWESIRIGFEIPRVVLPSIADILSALFRNFPYLVSQLGVTFAESIAGILFGTAFGCLLAVLFKLSQFLRRAIYPLALFIKATPLIALVPIVTLWLGSGVSSKIAMSAILCFFPVLVGCFDGLRKTNLELVELLRSYGASEAEILFRARLPATLPSLFSGLRIAIPLAIAGAIIGEYLSSTQGIRFVIANSSHHLETALVYAALLLTSICSLALFGLVSKIEAKIIFWKS